MNSPSIPEGPGSVAGAPNLPDGFAGTFPGCGHHPAEETPEETLAALTAFLAPYRNK